MKGFIHLKDVLAAIDKPDDSGRPSRHNIKVVTFSAKTRTGGDVLELNDVRRVATLKNNNAVYIKSKKTAPKTKKDHNHHQHDTINFMLPNKQIRKVYKRLIIEFDNQEVYF